MVAMAALRELLADLGFGQAQSLLQSGNLVFETRRRPDEVERVLEREAAARLGLETDVFVRTADEWRRLVERNPFPEAAVRDPSHLLVMVLREAPGGSREEALKAALMGGEVVHLDGRHLYARYPDGFGRSRLTGALVEKLLGTRGTGRNWNTVLKLGAAAGRSG